MNKEELVRTMAGRTGLSMKDCDLALSAALDSITAALAAGDTVRLTGFGTFETKVRAPRVARNPAKNEEVPLPETTVPAFKPGKGLKDAVK